MRSFRMLALAGDDDATTRLSKIRSFELILILGLVSETWSLAISRIAARGWAPGATALPVLVTIVAMLGLRHRRRRAALLGLMVIQLYRVIASFPMTANHVFLQLFLLIMVVSCDFEKEEEQDLFLQSARWLFVIVFFYAGVQKLVHGYYFQGEFFAYHLGRESFALGLQPFMSPGELERFTVEFTGRVGDGPYRFDSLAMVALSNAAYVAEIAIPLLWLTRRTRFLGVLAAVGFLVVTEFMAREFHFGLLFANGLLLFLPSDFNRKLVLPFAVVYAWMMLIGVRAVPDVTFY